MYQLFRKNARYTNTARNRQDSVRAACIITGVDKSSLGFPREDEARVRLRARLTCSGPGQWPVVVETPPPSRRSPQPSLNIYRLSIVKVAGGRCDSMARCLERTSLKGSLARLFKAPPAGLKSALATY